MKKYCLLFLTSCLFSLPALAEVKYIVGRNGTPKDAEKAAAVDEGERLKRFYVSGGYNFHFPNDLDGLKSSGRDGLTGAVGLFISESWRAELSYENMRDEYNGEKVGGNFGFLNFIFDAKLPPDYRIFKQNPFVAFAGFGVGGGMPDIGKGAELGGRFLGAYNLIGGVSVEVNRTIAFQLAYKYMKLLPNKLTIGTDVFKGFAPSGHNFAISFRMNF
ncbi:MAG: outer membrane beta-barrel protein [Rickettsiales bacterium]|jgi:hypothetical protein|nr:outer membrane beta-barrel protein [Rickettsiales bacterium]